MSSENKMYVSFVVSAVLVLSVFVSLFFADETVTYGVCGGGVISCFVNFYFILKYIQSILYQKDYEKRRKF
tara:strand:- start:248 stop:460 length:213 start_codon:yes stop_codon:yes gene_type:complete